VNKLTNKDLTWFYATTKEALGSIKNIGKKLDHEIDGEVFTYMRRLSRDMGGLSPAVRDIFAGKLKYFSSRMVGHSNKEEQEILRHMYNTLKDQRIKGESDSISDLQHILLALQASVYKVKQVVQASEDVRKGLDNIPNILEGKEEQERA
jgi:hypothetical protein